ncbi:MAG: polysaccharide export protein [Alphaproteobacteria bacterium]|nr:polysaccharide export protein [Alphaproteobacteria bacterium]
MPEGYQHAQTHQGAMPQTSMPQAAAPQASVVVVPPGPAPEYVLGVGDRIRIVVYNEPDMSGEFEVDSTGRVAMPLIGVLPAAGGTNRQLEQNIRALLSQGYLKDPRVNVEVLNYRPFFILGEVMKPNSYPYVNGMSVMSAVAIAGGYTYRGDKDKISIKRGNNKFRASETDSVLPGDIIEIEERFF